MNSPDHESSAIGKYYRDRESVTGHSASHYAGLRISRTGGLLALLLRARPVATPGFTDAGVLNVIGGPGREKSVMLPQVMLTLLRGERVIFAGVPDHEIDDRLRLGAQFGVPCAAAVLSGEAWLADDLLTRWPGLKIIEVDPVAHLHARNLSSEELGAACAQLARVIAPAQPEDTRFYWQRHVNLLAQTLKTTRTWSELEAALRPLKRTVHTIQELDDAQEQVKAYGYYLKCLSKPGKNPEVTSSADLPAPVHAALVDVGTWSAAEVVICLGRSGLHGGRGLELLLDTWVQDQRCAAAQAPAALHLYPAEAGISTGADLWDALSNLEARVASQHIRMVMAVDGAGQLSEPVLDPERPRLRSEATLAMIENADSLTLERAWQSLSDQVGYHPVPSTLHSAQGGRIPRGSGLPARLEPRLTPPQPGLSFRPPGTPKTLTQFQEELREWAAAQGPHAAVLATTTGAEIVHVPPLGQPQFTGPGKTLLAQPLFAVCIGIMTRPEDPYGS